VTASCFYAFRLVWDGHDYVHSLRYFAGASFWGRHRAWMMRGLCDSASQARAENTDSVGELIIGFAMSRAEHCWMGAAWVINLVVSNGVIPAPTGPNPSPILYIHDQHV